MVGVGGAATGAVQPRPTFPTVGVGHDVASVELFPKLGIRDALPHVAHRVVRIVHELMAGEQLPPGGHGQVLRAGAAAGHALVQAGAAGEIQHVVVEGEGPPLLLPLEHLLGQDLILRKELGQVLFRQGPGLAGGTDHRLHAQLGEAQVGHVEDVVGEVHVVVGEGPAHIIAQIAPFFHKTLEFGDNDVIAANPGEVFPQAVVDLFPAVQAEDDVVHLLVAELRHLIVQQDAVGGQGEAEILVVDGLLGAGVGHQVFHHLPVHQRLTAEEVHLQIDAGAGLGNQKVQGLLAHPKGHEGPLTMVLALAGEAVLAV